MVENITQLKWKNDKCQCECKNPRKHQNCEKYYVLNPRTCAYEDGNYLGSISSDSGIRCDEVIEVKKAVPLRTILTKIF